MKRDLAVVLVSGGMDSCVAAAIANQTYDLAFLHIKYGQKSNERELRAFEEIARHYGVEKRLVCSTDHLRQIGGSSLTDERIEISQARLDSPIIPTSYVPFRNAHFLSIAVSWAEVIGATKVFIGAVEEDSSGYPDCRARFYEVFNRLVEVGTKPDTNIEIVTPLIGMRKRDIVLRGKELNVPFHLTWSCYRTADIPCGTCDSCALRLRGFREAGVEDPRKYMDDRYRHADVQVKV